MQAIWKNAVLANSNATVVVEGNHYFPPASINLEYFQPSHTHTTCPWKGLASYYHIQVNGQVNQDAAWYYPEPKEAAKDIKIFISRELGSKAFIGKDRTKKREKDGTVGAIIGVV